ncbi:substrate-binding domain-containing protein [Catenulispora sp. NF23]|uniref:Substrate-binding domain-containing protein n=1 Tax=Catenulispora pinistramenti TaxID=2705254 RepID=A0ABS5KII9_9ACTN|nr:substrate-binding domain-containing protein [Catenulispora pinistramenti]MBS2536344.1 substrate-binding domain-containing protein [Catenulispora pinistramenti]MBS2545820.1 substrate-binding domain-containing protein [Catenulispora pinistramenti]
MHSTSILRRYSAVAVAAASIAALAACGSPSKAAGGSSGGGTPGGSAGSGAPIKVGLVYSETGPLADYGKDYYQGFLAGLDYATHGTDAVNGHKIEVTQRDDAGDPTKAVSAAKDLIGQGYRILAGSTASGVALQVAPLAAQNKVLFISGPAATDDITGLNKYTFRSGRETYQDIATAASFLGDLTDKHVTVLAQDDAFGQANVEAVKAVLGAKGAKVDSVLAPESANDLTPFATQAKNAKPDLLFVAWAGTTASALWTALSQQGVLDATTTVTGLDVRASYPIFAATGGKVSFLAHYVPGGTSNDAAKAMDAYLTAHGEQSDLFSPDGFTAAQMVVHAAASGDSDVDAMVKNLEGWSFDGVKGAYTIRASDHALLQPMFQAKLSGTTPTVVKTLDPNDVAPPAKSFPAS